jgi:Xaa-Pro aminopeptidase
VAPCDARREFISGFSGSAGTAVITQVEAALSTDGRYFNQATKQLDTNWMLLKQGIQTTPTWQEWAVSHAGVNGTIGIDPAVISAAEAQRIMKSIKYQKVKLIPIEDNLVDIVWGHDRPSRPSNPVKILPQHFAGKEFKTKLEDLQKELEKKRGAGFIVTMLDEIAWLFNLRGSDIDYNPVFYSYAAVTPTSTTLYVNSAQLDNECKTYLRENGVSIRPYEKIFEDTTTLGLSLRPTGPEQEIPDKRFLMSNSGSWALKRALGGELYAEEIRSPIADAKAIKNLTELEGMRSCHVRDGAALVEYFAWLEKELEAGATIDEVKGADKLEECRRKQKDFVGLSFDTISSTGPNAAVIHYKPQRSSCSVIDPNSVYLCDSGAQYLDGTTDTTRTLHFGTPTDMEKKTYTLVLKGHIALDNAIFPSGTSGFALDIMARQFLWVSQILLSMYIQLIGEQSEGLDYRHGTGHGVGSFLNVHEGPIGIGTRPQYAEVPLSPGHVISNEPGYYEDGKFGIRIENIFMVREVGTSYKFGDRSFYGFEHVTVVPYCRNMIDESLLTKKEKDWLNEYHVDVRGKLSSYFEAGSNTIKWLERETTPF